MPKVVARRAIKTLAKCSDAKVILRLFGQRLYNFFDTFEIILLKVNVRNFKPELLLYSYLTKINTKEHILLK